jgi:hypothetical protein
MWARRRPAMDTGDSPGSGAGVPLLLRPAWRLRPRNSPLSLARLRPSWWRRCSARWSTATSGITTCLSGVASLCRWPTSTSWGRPRVDDLVLTLWCASADLGAHAGAAEVVARLGRLVVRYDAGADLPLSAPERATLLVATARQPRSSIGGWVARLDDDAAARRYAATVGPELQAARG